MLNTVAYDVYKDISNVMLFFIIHSGGLHGRYRMVVGFTINCAISAYHLLTLRVQIPPRLGVLVLTLYDKGCQ